MYPTQLDIMEVWPTPWAKQLFLESNKLWFYSLVCSILGSVVQFFNHKRGASKDSKTKEKSSSESAVKTRSRRAKDAEKRGGGASNAQWVRLVKSVVTDASDIFIPGAVTGWLVTSPLTVGVATVISTTLSSKDIWDKYAGKN